MQLSLFYVRIIALSAGKGGVGKTTLSTNLGIVLTNFGFTVCVLDANFTAPDVATHFGMSPEYTIWEVLQGKGSIDDALYEHDCGLHIIPGNSDVKDYKKDIYKRLKRKMRRMKYDFVLIDTPPGLGDDAKSALIPAKEVIIVTNPEWTSLNNAFRMYHAAKKMKKKVLGLVINRTMVHEYEPNSSIIEQFTKLEVLGEIPEDVNVRKSIAVQSPVTLAYPESIASEKMRQIGAKICGIDYKPRIGLIDRIVRFFSR